MIPVIALVGRPNVGKSTLFNRLTRSRDALVADVPGLTRDRKYGDGHLDGRPFIVVDTGGLSGDREDLDALMAEQSWQAVEEADRIFFLVDGREGLGGADEAIAAALRRTGKPVSLVVIGCDTPEHVRELAAAVFRRHGDEAQLKLTPERLPIMTFHGFCAQLLKLAPQEAGVPLQFTLLDEDEDRWLKAEALDEMRRVGRNVVAHERLTGDIPEEGGAWADWLEERYRSREIGRDAWGSTYRLVVWPDSVGIVSYGPDGLPDTRDDLQVATPRG